MNVPVHFAKAGGVLLVFDLCLADVIDSDGTVVGMMLRDRAVDLSRILRPD